jgi:hypothetical protein
MNYSVETVPCKKVVITITRKNLWHNFIESWRDLVWCDSENKSMIDDVFNVLVPKFQGDTLNIIVLRRLFREGLTHQLMHNAMDHIDNGESNLIQIVVVDGDNKYIVNHEDIQY